MGAPADEPKLYGRRAFLGVSAVGLSSLFWGKPVWDSVTGVLRPIRDALPPGLVPSGWRIYTVASSMPSFDPQTWRLRIDGLVEKPQSLSYHDLRKLPRAEQRNLLARLFLMRLFLAGVERKSLGANDLAVQGARNERLAFGLPSLGVGDGDAIDFERAPDGALVIGLGFGEVGESAKFRALRVDEVALRLNDEVNG